MYTGGECKWRIGEIKRWVRRMSKMTEVFWDSVPKSWLQHRLRSCCRTKEDETGGADKERYDDDEPVNMYLGNWMVNN